MADISVDAIAEAIAEELSSYSEEVENMLAEEIDELSKEIVNELKNDSTIPARTGEYKRGFRVKEEAKGNGYKRNRIYNKKYQLTHLLEKGHKTRNGGKARAFPHWEKAQKKADELDERFKRRLKK